MTARAHRMPVPGSAAVSLWRAGEAMAIRAKTLLAQRLIAWAWNRTLATGAAVKPWPGADIFPVARLEVPLQGAALMVLAGANGRTLAFGPGHVEGTPLPGDPGNAVVSGHRTHFAFLRDLRSGDTLVVHSASGRVVRYVVSGIEVVRNKDVRILLDAGDDRLTLVTCYPFDSPVPGGSLRYVVVATRRDAAVKRIQSVHVRFVDTDTLRA
jgi:sortase A